MVGIEQILQARERIAGAIGPTPLSRSESFTSSCGCKTLLKFENVLRTGSFKERGALNHISTLSEEQRRTGLITASAGNHAQALAYHGRRLGCPTKVVMPKRTPLIKVANARGFGAEVILFGDSFDDAYAHALELRDEQKLQFVPPFDDDYVIAGQGTVALELMDQAPDLDMVVVPIGGGGLISGIAAAFKSLRPRVRIIGVQSARVPSMKHSLEMGEPTVLPPATTIADGIAVKRPGKLTFPMVRQFVDDIVTVTEEEIANAVLLLLEREKTVVEGAGATGLAAIYNGHVEDTEGKKVGIILSGGNIDVNLIGRIIDQGLSKDGRMVRLAVKAEDRPGTLARILKLVAEVEANVLEVHHQRAFNVGLDEVSIELTLETRGSEHLGELVTHLESNGVQLEITDQPTVFL